VRNGGKRNTIALAPRTSQAIDLPVGERSAGPIFLTVNKEAAGPARRRPSGAR
jgi:hypothetical protein